MIAFQGIRNAAACEEHPPQERRPAALLLQQGKIDVQHQILPGIIAQQIDDVIQLFPLRDLKDHLSGRAGILLL